MYIMCVCVCVCVCVIHTHVHIHYCVKTLIELDVSVYLK